MELLYADLIKERLSEEGYEIALTDDDDVFQVKDLESGLVVTCALQETILFNTLPCFTIPGSNIDLALTRELLRADNGISTSSFQLFELPDGRFSVALTNFCKLQAMGADDHDDILSCLSFLLVDAVAARQLLSDFL